VRRKEWNEPETSYTPKTAVILSLRGPDPFVRRCLDGLLTQDYPGYTVFIVIDHAEDPEAKH
jgi:cellulose synthase/poly-beta-1,6-N-acetylglucosamine synthase-like glycosyltransferase